MSKDGPYQSPDFLESYLPDAFLLLHFVESALQTMLKRHVVVEAESKKGTHDVDNGATLSEESIDNGSTTRNKRSFEHV